MRAAYVQMNLKLEPHLVKCVQVDSVVQGVSYTKWVSVALREFLDTPLYERRFRLGLNPAEPQPQPHHD